MKKLNITLTALAVVGLSTLSLPSYSATFLGIKAGVDYWYADAKMNNVKVGDSSFQPSLYVSVEHFIPLVPNGKIRYTSVDVNSTLYNTTFDQIDLIGYYEILDNDLISIDVGINLQNFNGTLRGQAFDEWQPNLYGDVRIGIPATPISLFTTFSAGSFDDTHTVDAEAGGIFTVDLALIDLNFKVGYRIQDYDFNYSSFPLAKKQSIMNQGAFVGVELNF